MQHGYELTDRGKIIIAVVIALVFFLLPAAIFMFSALADKPPDNLDPEASWTPPSIVETPPSQTIQSPPPSGGDFSPPEVTIIPPETTTDNPGEDVPEDGNNQVDPPGPGPVGGNPSEGTLSFMFSPNLQETLDEKTASLLGEFLSFSGNTEDSVIAVELPLLSAEAKDNVINAVINAFAERGVPQRRLTFIVNQSGEAGDMFLVSLSYISQDSK